MRRSDSEQILLRVFFGESDRCPSGPHEGKPLHHGLVLTLRELGFKGATVVRGVAGFGGSALIHSSSILRLSTDLPMILEVVDTEERIEEILPVLEDMMESGLVTMEKARVILYGPNKDD